MFRILRSPVYTNSSDLSHRPSLSAHARSWAGQEGWDRTPKTQEFAKCWEEDKRNERDCSRHCRSLIPSLSEAAHRRRKNRRARRDPFEQEVPISWESFTDKPANSLSGTLSVQLNTLLSNPKIRARQESRKRSLEPQKAGRQDWIAKGTP